MKRREPTLKEIMRRLRIRATKERQFDEKLERERRAAEVGKRINRLLMIPWTQGSAEL